MANNNKKKKQLTTSIVITAYNVSETIEQAVKSAIAQNAGEVIVVEDKSKDNTLEILHNLLKETDNGFILVENEKNVGSGLGRRIGVEHSTGDYVLFLDGDDYLDEGFVRGMMNKSQGSDIVCGGVIEHYESGNVETFPYEDSLHIGLGKFDSHLKEKVSFLNNKLVRRTLYDKVPYSARRYAEETATTFPLLYYANELRYVDVTGYHYIRRGDSLTGGASDAKRWMFMALCMSDLIDWFSDKERKYRDRLKRIRFLTMGSNFYNCKEEDREKVKKDFPKEFAEFEKRFKEWDELYWSFQPDKK